MGSLEAGAGESSVRTASGSHLLTIWGRTMRTICGAEGDPVIPWPSSPRRCPRPLRGCPGHPRPQDGDPRVVQPHCPGPGPPGPTDLCHRHDVTVDDV